jgi:cell division protein FtsI (penicillin-binding protein 3)
VLLAVVFVLFGALAARTAYLQAVDPDQYVALSAEQTLRTQTLAAERGAIYDRRGYELALSVPRTTIYTDPEFVTDPDDAAAALAPVLGVTEDELAERLGADNRFGYLARQVTDDVADEVAALELDGVYLIEEPHRYAPSGDLAQSLVGITDIDNRGLGGIELLYDEQLAGTPGRLTYEQDPAGRTIAVGEHDLVAPDPGDGLVLTLDRALQWEAERVLQEHVARNGARSGMLVAMQPDSGEILAMANVEVDEESGAPEVSTNNLALTTVYEPGSVMKIIPLAAGLEEGLVHPQGECINAPDELSVEGSVFKEYEAHGGGCWPLEDVLVNSSNTGTINVALRVGAERMHDYFGRFGLGQETGLGFPAEQSGYVRPLQEWWGTSIATMPIGQGISVTPLQMLMAYNTVANDGVYVPPRLTRATIDDRGREHPIPGEDGRRVVSVETAEQVQRMLTEVVTRGTGQAADVGGFFPAGTTGTAQIPAPDGGYEWTDGRHYMATFCGFLPADDPQLSVCVVIEHPTAGAYTGGSVSAPAFADFGEFAVSQLHLSPSNLELAPEDLGTADPTTAADDHIYFQLLGTPPEGRVRAEPTLAPDEQEAADAGASDAGADTTTLSG